MITPAQIEITTAYAREKDSTFAGVRRFLEVLVENADRAAQASRGGIALDSVPRTSRYMNPECFDAASAIWDAAQTPDPLPFFMGKTWRQGMADYQAHIGKLKSKEEAYV